MFKIMNFLIILLLSMISVSKQSQGGGSESDSTKILRKGRPLALKCQIPKDDESEIQISWFKDNTMLSEENERYKIFQSNSSLLIHSATVDDVGFYRCQTENRPVDAFNITVVLISYKKLPKSTTVLQADKLNLTCEVTGVPPPVIVWTKDGINVKEALNASHYTLSENNEGLLDAIFFVSEADYPDYGEYMCLISTEGLLFNTTTYVRVKDMYGALWPFLGICAEVVILCIIIFIYEKRRMKIEFQEADDVPEPKVTAGQNKDLRQRK